MNGPGSDANSTCKAGSTSSNAGAAMLIDPMFATVGQVPLAGLLLAIPAL